MRYQSILKFAILFMAAAVFFEGTALASPGRSFSYDAFGNAVAAPDAYEVSGVVNGLDIGCGPLKKPGDMFIGQSGEIYILDTGNNRIVIVDSDFKLAATIDSLTNGQEVSNLDDAQGLYVDGQGRIYVADTGNNRLVCIDRDGNILKQFNKPDDSSFAQEKEFLPIRVVADRSGNLYVIATGINDGMLVFDSEAGFQGFYGSNQVVQTMQVITDFFWKQLMTKEQKEQLGRQVPPELRSLEIDDNDFIFSITNMRLSVWADYKDEMDKIRKLNSKGKDILVNKMPSAMFSAFQRDGKSLNYVDVCSDEEGFISIIDNAKGKVLQFDPEMNLITGFGALGDFQGMFRNPTAIETFGGKIYVLDAAKNNVTVFAPTEFGKKVRSAVITYSQGNYEDAIGPWNEVMVLNSNYTTTYIGIGNALLNQQKYKDAMKYFELGRDSVRYSEAFKLYRISVIRGAFGWIVFALLAAAGLVLFLRKRKRAGTARK